MKRLLALSLCALLAVACTRPREVDGYHLVVLPASGRGTERSLPVVFAEVVSTHATRARGLAGRKALAEDGGMLFVYRTDATREFWMKGCLIGLDIAFLASDGTIETLTTLPDGIGRSHDEMPRAPSRVPVRYVLETASGWMSAHGIKAGDRVDVRQAVSGIVPE